MCDGTKGRYARRTMMAWLVIGFLMLTAAGCARPDWIEQTLVTVDVTGVWRGTITRMVGGSIVLTLQQSDPKVTGKITIDHFSGGGRIDGDIEGTVTGDIFITASATQGVA